MKRKSSLGIPITSTSKSQSDPLAIEIETLRRQNDKLSRSVKELSVLNELATTIAVADDLEAVMRTVVQQSLRALGAEQGVITLVDDQRDDPMKTLIRTSDMTNVHAPLRPDQHVLGWMQYHKKPLVIDDPHGDTRFGSTQWDPTIRSVLSVPMMTQGRLIGILTLYNKNGSGGFQPADQRLISIIAAQSAKIIENAHLREERNHIHQLFGQHTSPEVVTRLLGTGAEPGSTRKHVCVMFLDIRGFTTFSEQRDPEEVVAYLNSLFAFTIDLVNENNGIIHQLLGDGFMALYGAPISYGNDTRNAVETALAIIRRVETEVAAGTIPPTRLGIGLHSGEVVAGTVGSEIHKEYKVTGDVVNVAARIEQLTKKYDAQLLVSEPAWQELEPGSHDGHPLQETEIRGRSGTIRLYKLA